MVLAVSRASTSAPGEAIGDAVIVSGDLDVIIDADAAAAPLREIVRLCWQGFQRRTIDLFEQLPARHAEPADRTLLVEMRQKVADRRVDLRQAIKCPVTQPSQQPSLDDEHGLLNLRLVPGSSRPCRQNGGVVMRGHLGVGAIDLRIVEAGLDHRRLRIVWHEQMRNAADCLHGAHVGVDPVGECLRPARASESEARRAKHGDEDLHLADFAGQPVDDDRNAIASVIHKQSLAARMRLPHRRRQLRFKIAIKFTESRITTGIGGDIFVPDDQ